MDPQRDPRPVPTISSLPYEILQQILEHFCTHCCPGPPGDEYDFTPRPKCIRTLQALAVTSKCLRSAVLPILLHQPDDHMSPKGLARLLRLHPHLGVHVRQVELPLLEEGSDDVEFFKSAARDMLVAAGDDAEFSQAERHGLRCETLAAEVLMVYAPQVDTFFIELYDSNNWSRAADFKYLSNHLKRVGDGTGFESIRRLFIRRPVRTSTAISNPTILSLLGATTNLEHLNLSWMLGFDLSSLDGFDIENIKPACRSLKTLSLNDCIFRGDSENSDFGFLSEMLRHASNLQTFRFSMSMSAGEPSYLVQSVMIKTFIRSLQPVAPTLKHLQLNFRGRHWNREHLDAVEFSAFHNLEVLDLNFQTVCWCRDPRPKQEETTTTPRITDVIPASVTRLRLRVSIPNISPCQECLVDLGNKAAQGSIPALRRLEIKCADGAAKFDQPFTAKNEYILPILESYRKAFENTHISLHFYAKVFVWIRDSNPSQLAWMNVHSQ